MTIFGIYVRFLGGTWMCLMWFLHSFALCHGKSPWKPPFGRTFFLLVPSILSKSTHTCFSSLFCPKCCLLVFFFNVQSRANFQEKTWAARNPTSTPTIKKNYFIVSFRGQLVFKRLVTEYIPSCFLCLDYIYLHEFGETWPRAHDQGERNGFDAYIPIFPGFCSFWCARSERPMNGDGWNLEIDCVSPSFKVYGLSPTWSDQILEGLPPAILPNLL